MRVLLSVSYWGADYAALLADYTIASQLSENNIPRLAEEHEVTYHFVTTRRDAKRLRNCDNVRLLKKYCNVVWEYFEDYGYNPDCIPCGPSGEKYHFLSKTQNISIKFSLDYDILAFNYADFIWSDGSLYNSISRLKAGGDAVLSFCLPVDRDPAKEALDGHRHRKGRASIIKLTPRDASAIAIDHLHREARLRYWDSPKFTMTPTYLLWPVADKGLIIRAYHQTVLALRVQPDNAQYVSGIPYGSLDGYFTSVLAENGVIEHVTDSDEVLVFSLYDTAVDSSLKSGATREQSLRRCLRDTVSKGQRRFAKVPIFVKREEISAQLCEQMTKETWDILRRIHQSTRFDRKAFDLLDGEAEHLSIYEKRWRTPHQINLGTSWIIQRFLPKLATSKVGRAIKRSRWKERSRAMRLKIEEWLLRDGT